MALLFEVNKNYPISLILDIRSGLSLNFEKIAHRFNARIIFITAFQSFRNLHRTQIYYEIEP